MLAYQPDRSQAAFVFQTKYGTYNTASLIEFLTGLREHLDRPGAGRQRLRAVLRFP
ncbi:hypothetical protein [Saccharopolyspora spinosa]|uniref:Uncharacterized protein n=1 Tax=Saccharopolyspora spinosa TaxID=60894 RepID=A0A2N3Y0B9_SACSN|nr:hypothetical protein [Saccharopolyspora spinosa]PKW16364.1 hypothetical protein A8926_4188 [Saccharopolyspora spinosa]